jgi:glyoxylase-like metal-dependent hydrolase (beta-lactamase superfamily II)
MLPTRAPAARAGGVHLLFLTLVFTLAGSVTPAAAQEPEVFAVRYGTIRGFPMRGLLPDAPEGEQIDIAMAVWVVRTADRVVLFDTGFFRPAWFERFEVSDFVRPDEALAGLGLTPEDVTDVVVSHAHWDHMGGLELFPSATAWIQRDEFVYYAGQAWQEGARRGGIDAADVLHLVERNTRGLVRLVDGDGVEIIPGLTVYTGSRHTFASQYLRVAGDAPIVLASDNVYLWRAIAEGRSSATFEPADRPGNVAAARRMVELAGAVGRVIPGHDPETFVRFPAVAEGIVRIR